jgi:hypothetical protein
LLRGLVSRLATGISRLESALAGHGIHILVFVNLSSVIENAPISKNPYATRLCRGGRD